MSKLHEHRIQKNHRKTHISGLLVHNIQDLQLHLPKPLHGEHHQYTPSSKSSQS